MCGVCGGEVKVKKLIPSDGRSMVEMLGVLAIVGVLSTAGIYGYSYAMTKHKSNKMIEQFGMLTNDIRAVYANKSFYDGISTAALRQLGVLTDAECAGSNNCIDHAINAFGGEMTIAPVENKASVAFTITMAGLPRGACIMVLQTNPNESSGVAEALNKITVRRYEANTPVDTTFDAAHLPPKLIDAAASCSDNSSITWTLF